MRVLPLAISALAALAIAPSLLQFLRENGHVRTNYRDAAVPCPLGQHNNVIRKHFGDVNNGMRFIITESVLIPLPLLPH